MQFLVKVSQLFFSPTNGRSEEDPAAVRELAADIKENGLINALTCRPKLSKNQSPPFITDLLAKDGEFEIIAGNRRFKAIKTIPDYGLVKIEADNYSDEQAGLIQASENIHRKDLRPMEELTYYERFLKTMTIDQLVSKIGKTKNYVTSVLQLRKLIPEFTKYLNDGSLPVEYAKEICKVDPAVQKKLFSDEYILDITKGKIQRLLTLHEVKKVIFQDVSKPINSAIFSLSDPDLYKEAGACNVCPYNTGANADLFLNSSKEAVCTKTSCFQIKLYSHIRNRIKELEKIQQPYKLLYEEDYSASGNKHVEKLECQSSYRYSLSKIKPKEDLFVIGIFIDVHTWNEKHQIGEEFYITPKATAKDKATAEGKKTGKKEEPKETPTEMRERRMLKRFEREDDLDKVEVRKAIMKEVFKQDYLSDSVLKDVAEQIISEAYPGCYDLLTADYKIKKHQDLIDQVKSLKDLVKLIVKAYAADNLQEHITTGVNLTDIKFDHLIRAAKEYRIDIAKLHKPFIDNRKKERTEEIAAVAAAKKRAAARAKKSAVKKPAKDVQDGSVIGKKKKPETTGKDLPIKIIRVKAAADKKTAKKKSK